MKSTERTKFAAPMHQIQVSIVTPTLNAARFLPNLLESVTSQHHHNWQHIFVDGGSNDGTRDILERHVSEEPRARLVNAAQEGLYPAIFEGFAHADGDVYCWIGADDLYTPWALSTIVRYMNGSGSDWVTGLPACWDCAGQLRYIRPYGRYPRRLIAKGWFHERLLGYLQQESIFFTRTLFDALTDAEVQTIKQCELAGDFALWRAFARHTSLEVVPTTIAGFRVSGENKSTRVTGAYYKDVIRLGATTLPRPLADLARLTFARWSAIGLIKQVNAEDLSVTKELI